MSKTPITPVLIIAAFCVALFFSASSSTAQQSDEQAGYAPADTVFVEINLTPDGVYAVDSAGWDWYYDFEHSQFVVGVLPGARESGRSEDDRLPSQFLPVEERCTIEKRVKPYTYGNVRIGEDEFVAGNVKASGQVTVRGWVQGTIVSNDRILVKAGGRVDGDIAAPEIILQEGGVVLGDQIITDVEIDLGEITEVFSISGVLVILILTAVFLFCGFLLVTLMPRQMKDFGECIDINKVKAFAVGFLFFVLLPVLMTLLIITIVGIVLLPVVPVLYAAAIVMGVIAAGDRIGRKIAVRFMGGEQSMLLQSMLGTVVIMLPWFITFLMIGSSVTTVVVLGWVLFGMTVALSTYPLFTGIGSAYLTRFGFRYYGGPRQRRERPGTGPAPAPAPPPIPNAPPEPRSRPFPDQGDETSSPGLRKE